MTILWPLDTVNVTGQFGNSPEFYAQFGQLGHNGIDLAASIGTPVYATDHGTVVAEGWGSTDSWMGSIAGIFVRVGHTWGYSAYAHLSSTIVNVGQWVNRGQLIGYSGATGVGTGPHLHFETFPMYPNFGNGYAGRINPHTFGVVSRKQPSTPNTSKPSKPWEATMQAVEHASTLSKKQVIRKNVNTRVQYNPKGEVTLAFGPLHVINIAPSVRVTGEPGTRVQVNLYRDKISGGKVVATRKISGARAVIDTLGMAEVNVSCGVKLPNNWRIRVGVQASDVVTVEDFRWSGYVAAL